MRARYENRRYVLVTAALAIVILIDMAGLGIDVDVLRYEQRHRQSAADSAAIASASELGYDQVTSAALADAAKNGFQDGSSNGVSTVSVAVHNPPTDGPHTGNINYVEVIIGQLQPTFFVKIFNINSAMVQARAVAYGGAASTNCIYALDPSASNTIVTSGSGQINANCGIVDDSADSSKAFVDSGQACVSATQFGIVGGASISSSCPPTPVTGIVRVPDPLAYVQPPSVGSCDVVNYKLSGGVDTINPDAMTVRTSWAPNNQPGSNVTVSVSYDFQLNLPFLPSEGITMSSNSEMVISQ